MQGPRRGAREPRPKGANPSLFLSQCKPPAQYIFEKYDEITLHTDQGRVYASMAYNELIKEIKEEFYIDLNHPKYGTVSRFYPEYGSWNDYSGQKGHPIGS